MEYKKPHARYDEFADQFTSVMYDHWSAILQIVNRHSPRLATLLRTATPRSLKRTNGTWHVQVITKRLALYEKLRQPHDNEIVGQAIRLWAQSAASLKLPRVVVDFAI